MRNAPINIHTNSTLLQRQISNDESRQIKISITVQTNNTQT